MNSSVNPQRRRWTQPFDQPLPATARWVASLPEHVQPLALLQQFPRIANALARVWHDNLESRLYLDDLLIDRRGGRQGFPADVHHELLVLREHYEQQSSASF